MAGRGHVRAGEDHRGRRPQPSTCGGLAKPGLTTSAALLLHRPTQPAHPARGRAPSASTHLALGRQPHQALPLVGESNHRGGGALALGVLNDLGGLRAGGRVKLFVVVMFASDLILG